MGGVSTSPIPYPILVIDTASRRVCVAAMTQQGTAAIRQSGEEASLSLFPSVKAVLLEIGCELPQLRAIAFCQGPGSMLGMRTAVMGIRTWKSAGLLNDCPIFSFSSLEVGRQLIASRTDAPFLVVTDARRSSWNVLESNQPVGSPARLIDNRGLEHTELPVFSFDEFPSWTRTQAPIERFGYRPETVILSKDFASLLTPNSETAIPIARPQAFAKWVPQARTGDRIAP